MANGWPRRAAAALLGLVVAATSTTLATSAAAGAAHHRPVAHKRTIHPKSDEAPLGRHVVFGAYAAGFPGAGSQVTQLEGELSAHLRIASSFRGPGDVFPDRSQRADAASGHVLLVSWDMGSDASDRFTTYTDGAHDAYLAAVASAVASFGSPIYIRPWAEMNADWSPFQPTADGSAVAGGTPEEFIAAWRYVVAFFRSHGATNARWVFGPSTDTYSETTDVASIFPGSAYVDVLGLDGYNWGNGGLLHWESFTDIYSAQYQRLVSLDPADPVWVCEFGSKEPAEDDGAPVDPDHSKARWYRSMFSSTSFPAIKALIFFDADKERDWRIDSDPQTLQVVTAAVQEGS